MIYIKYFGPLASELGLHEEKIEWQPGDNTQTLLNRLRQRDTQWETTLATNKVFKVVVNKQICHEITEIPQGAEVGILPPVTGG